MYIPQSRAPENTICRTDTVIVSIVNGLAVDPFITYVRDFFSERAEDLADTYIFAGSSSMPKK